MTRPIIAAEIGYRDTTTSPIGTGTLYLASEWFTTDPTDALANQTFEGRLDGRIDYKLMLSAPFWDGRTGIAIGSVEVQNEDGGLDSWVSTPYEFRDQTITIKRLNAGDSYDTATTVITAIVEDFKVVDERRYRFVIRDPAAVLYQPMNTAAYPNASPDDAPDATGTIVPISFGAPKLVKPVLVDESALKYRVHDAAIATAAVYDQGVAADFAQDFTNGGFTLLADPTGSIRCSPITSATGDDPTLAEDTASPLTWLTTNELRRMTSNVDSISGTSYRATSANKSRASSDGGKYYFEFVVTAVDESAGSHSDGTEFHVWGGISSAAIVNPQSPKDTGFYVFGATVSVSTDGYRPYNNGTEGGFLSTGVDPTGDVIGVAVDFASSPMTVTYYKNGSSYSGPHGIPAGTYTPVVGVDDHSGATGTNQVTIQFLADDTTYDPPAGHSYWANIVADTSFNDFTSDLATRTGLTFDSTSVSTIDALAHSSPEVLYTYGYYLDRAVTPAQILNWWASSVGGVWWVNSSGEVEFAQLAAPGASVLTFDDTSIIGEIQAWPDLAPNLSDGMGANKNWEPYRESEIASGATEVTRQQFSRGYQDEYRSSTAMANPYSHATGAEFPESLLVDSTAAQTEADRVAALYATERRFWRIKVAADAATVDTVMADFMQAYTIKSSRFGLSGGLDLLLVGVETTLLENEITLTLWGAPAPTKYTTTGKTVGGANYYSKTAWMGADGTDLTIVFAAKMGSGGSDAFLLRAREGLNTDTPELIYSEANGRYDLVELDTAGNSNMAAADNQTNDISATAESWHGFAMVIDSSAGTVEMWVNGANIITNGSLAATGTMDLTKSQVRFGSISSGEDWDVSHVWMSTEAVDMSTKWSSFFDGNNKPIDLGADGSTPTGRQPEHFAPDGDLSTNLGSEANWTVNGTINNSATSPTD